MALRLVIAEKPSVAQTIAAALGVKGKQDGYIEGGGYLISWCVGHLVQLAEAAAYGEQYRKWQLDSLPILPEEWQYAVDPDKGKQFATLKELMHRADVSEVINACDAGREGELIFRFVYEVAGCKKPMRRLWISSMEDGAIKAGFASLKDGREYPGRLGNGRNYQDTEGDFPCNRHEPGADRNRRIWLSPPVGRRKVSDYGERDAGVCRCRRAAGKGKPVEVRRGHRML